MFRKLFLLISTAIILLINISCKNQLKTKVIWEFQTKGKTTYVHFTHNNYLYVTAGKYLDYGSPNRYVYCINTNTGKVKWMHDIGNEILMQHFTLFKNKIIWIGNENQPIIVLDAVSGKMLNTIIKSQSIYNVKVPKNILYKGNKCFIDRGNYIKRKPRRIYCIDKKTKEQLWSFIVRRIKFVYEPDEIDFTFLIFIDKLLIGNHDGKITCVKIFK